MSNRLSVMSSTFPILQSASRWEFDVDARILKFFFFKKSTNHRRVSVDNCWWVISWRSEVIVRHKKNLGKIKNTNVSHSRQACVNYAAQYRRAGKSDETWKFSESIAEISLTRCLHSAYVHSKRSLAEKIVCENLAKIVYVAAEVICT